MLQLRLPLTWPAVSSKLAPWLRGQCAAMRIIEEATVET